METTNKVSPELLKGVTLRIDSVTLSPEQLQLAWPTWQKYREGRLTKAAATATIRRILRKREVPIEVDDEEEETA